MTCGSLSRLVACAALSLGAALTLMAAASAADDAPRPVAGSPAEAHITAARKYFPSDDAAPPAKRLFRLTRDQLDATVATLLPGARLPSVTKAMARDPLQTNYEYADILSLNGANIAALASWIGEIAGIVRAKPALVVDCPAEDARGDCRTSAARRFVVRAFRGDVGDDKVEAIVAFYLDGVKKADPAQAAGDLVEVVLNSPDFLFRKELDVDRSRRLAPTQLLQALSYVVADAPPERVGLSSDTPSRHLARGAGNATIDALVQSKPARAKLVRFFKAWLEVKEPGEFTISEKVFPEFNEALAAAMIYDTERFLSAELAKPAPKLTDITEATRAFVSAPVASLYGIAATGDAKAAKPVALDPAQRLGIFSQPAVIASHSGPTNTRPVKRGVFWVRKVMCLEMQPPPQGVDTTLYDITHTTERERIEQLTAKTACIGCHKLIDPLGFFQERFDALGRWRETDNGFPIDTAVTLDFLDEGEIETKTPVEALKVLTRSAMFKQCFVRQMLRYYLGRSEEPADDPLLRAMFLELAASDDLIALVRMLAASDRIARRG